MNQFGQKFRISIYGESHGDAVGILLDGIPPGISIVAKDFEPDLLRRKAGGVGTTTRIEEDQVGIVSGVYLGFSTGSPIHLLFRNQNTISSDYTALKNIPRPGHADFVAMHKFGPHYDSRGGGHFSGRLTLALVAAGVIAKKIIQPIQISATLIEVGGSADLDAKIEEAIRLGDSVGGIVECVGLNIPIGYGEPFFDSVESLISHLAFSIPAIKGIEFGSGFQGSRMFGSEHNDEIISQDGKTKTNHAGGINGGVTNGNALIFKVAVKPTSSIKKSQESIDMSSGEKVSLAIQGRHDVCIALRVPVVIEAITAIALADLKL